MQFGKVVIAGPSAAGKTCIVIRVAKDDFTVETATTMTAAFFRKEYVIDNVPIGLSIWDTAGQERFSAVSPVYFRGAQFALICYDCNNLKSFESVKYWTQQVKIRAEPTTICYLLANKCDLEKLVPVEEAQSFAKENNLMYYEVSAKTGQGLSELFEDIGRRYIKSQEQTDTAKVQKIVVKQKEEEDKKSCC